MTKLYRSTNNKMLAGICGGLGELLEIDPTVVRLIFAASLLFPFPSIIVYVLGWIIIPKNPGYTQL